MGNHLLPADSAGYAYHLRTDTVGVLPVAQVGRCMGEVADKVSDRPFLRCDALLWKFLLACILLVINYISFSKQFT